MAHGESALAEPRWSTHFRILARLKWLADIQNILADAFFMVQAVLPQCHSATAVSCVQVGNYAVYKLDPANDA